MTRFSGFSETLVPLSWPNPVVLCAVTFSVPSGGPRHATIDANLAFTRSGVGPLAVGYFVLRSGVPAPTENRRYRGIEVTGQHFPSTYVWHDGPLTGGTNVTYQLLASKLRSSAEDASSTGCEMTVTLD